MRFRSRVVEIDAAQWSPAAVDDMPDWFYAAAARTPGSPGAVRRDGEHLRIYTLEGTMTANPGDWIIRGTEGELYPCRPSVFARKYEPV